VGALIGLIFVKQSVLWTPIGGMVGLFLGVIVGFRVEWDGTIRAAAADQAACEVAGCLIQALIYGCFGCCVQILSVLSAVALLITTMLAR
jgi:hypothetical protein